MLKLIVVILPVLLACVTPHTEDSESVAATSHAVEERPTAAPVNIEYRPAFDGVDLPTGPVDTRPLGVRKPELENAASARAKARFVKLWTVAASVLVVGPGEMVEVTEEHVLDSSVGLEQVQCWYVRSSATQVLKGPDVAAVRIHTLRTSELPSISGQTVVFLSDNNNLLGGYAVLDGKVRVGMSDVTVAALEGLL